MLSFESVIVREGSFRVLSGGMGIWDRFKDSACPTIRRTALKEQCKALVNHDRIMTRSKRPAL